MNRYGVAVAAMVLSACAGGWRQDCLPDGTCKDGLVCVQGVCLSGSDLDASVTSACPAACGSWQSCDARRGQCADLTLLIAEPRPDAVFEPGASVRVVAYVTTADGSAPPIAEVPVEVSNGILGVLALRRGSENSFVGDFRLPMEVGRHTIKVGWSVVNQTLELQAGCSSRCGEWQRCVADPNGGRCTDLRIGLRWLSPQAGQVVAPNTNVPLELEVIGFEVDAFEDEIPIAAAGSTSSMTRRGSTWTGSTFSPGSEGSLTIVAGWPDAGISASTSFFVDATPPQLRLVWPSDASVYQRDDLVPVILAASESIADASVRLQGIEAYRRDPSFCTKFQATQEARACFEVDFSRPSLMGLEGRWTLAVDAVDEAGNGVSIADAGETVVSRVRWTSFPYGGVFQSSITSLMVSPDGTVIVGVASRLQPSTGAIVRVDPRDGRVLSTIDAGAVVSLTHSRDCILYASNGSAGGQFGCVSTSSVFPLDDFTTFRGQSLTYSGIAVVDEVPRPPLFSAPPPVVLGSYNASPPFEGVLRPYTVYGGSGNALPGSLTDSFEVTEGSIPSAAVNVVIRRAHSPDPMASFLRKQTFAEAIWQPVTNILDFARPDAGVAIPLGSVQTIPVAQALLGNDQLLIALRGGGAGNIALINTPPQGQASVTFGRLDAGDMVGAPAVANLSEAYAGVGTSLARFDPQNLRLRDTLIFDGGSDLFVTTPVLTRPGSGGKPLGYAQSRLGRLVVFELGDGGVVWSEPLGSYVLPRAHPAFDCNRSSSQTQTGVLYLDLGFGRFQAIVVDSPALLDTPNAWPKYQRSMGNAGNDDIIDYPTNWRACQ